MRKCTINEKRYDVHYEFNMVGNYFFLRKGFAFLVDAEDVSVWVEENELKFEDGVSAAIAYAKDIANLDEDGTFWWKAKEVV